MFCRLADEARIVAVVGGANADFGGGVVAVVKPTDTAPAAELLCEVRDARPAAYKVSRESHFVDELPRNVMGKIRKNVLRARVGPRQDFS